MRFTFLQSLCDITHLKPLAIAPEQYGFDSFTVLKGDRWMHAGGDRDQLAPPFARLDAIRRAEGRAGQPFEVHVNSLDACQPDGIRRLEDQGVTDVIVGLRNVYDPATVNQPVQENIDAMRHYADSVIAHCR